jgi:hypothetical protein
VRESARAIERERVCVCVHACVCEREMVCGKWVRERESVCVCAREREIDRVWGK